MFPISFSFSQSSLQDYADCPRRFYLRYLEKLTYPAMESEPALEHERHQQEGRYFHRLIQQHLLGIPEGKLAILANTPNLNRWWSNYLATIDLDGLSSIYPEITLSAPLAQLRLVAKYDLIGFNEEGQAVIYDWKTYRKRPRNEWLAARWQTRVYRALLVKVGDQFNGGSPIVPDRCEMIYWFADFPEEPARFQYSTPQFKQDWETILNIAEEIQSAAFGKVSGIAGFPLTDDLQKCSYCPYRSYCDRGTQAGELENAEVEMQSEEIFDINFEQIGEIEF